jgi:hypothetical protein
MTFAFVYSCVCVMRDLHASLVCGILVQDSKLDAGLAMIIKQRVKAGAIERMDLVGTVEGCDCVSLKQCE